MTPGITFHAWTDEHYGTTAEVLGALGERLEHLRWRLEIDEANTDEPERFDQQKERETAQLIEFLDDVQIIDGSLEGRRPGDDEPYVTLRAVDSSWWDVESDDPRLLDAVRAKYPDAFDIPT
jgi:hypothetical protein